MFLREVLPELLNCVPIDIIRRMWFKYDGAPAYCNVDVRIVLYVYLGLWIGRASLIKWPARLPDLSCQDFFFWDKVNSLIYEDDPMDSAEDLVAWIPVVADTIRELSGV